MLSGPKNHNRVLVVALLAAVLLGSLLVSGCSGATSGKASGTASTDTSAGAFPATTPKPGEQPPPPMLRDPRTAVYSYQLWISYAYRVLNSDVASRTFSPYEEVRVNSYVEFNRQEGRAIDQKIVVAKVKSVESKGATATVAMHEEWVYRYISTKTGLYSSPANSAAYETTYTVIKQRGDWVVDSVVATSAAGPIK